jgi:hypothetical protein
MAPGNLTLCSYDAASFPAATGTVLEPNQDLLLYYLTVGTNPATWNVIATSNTPSFSFDAATMLYGTTYQVMAVAGNSAAGWHHQSDRSVPVGRNRTYCDLETTCNGSNSGRRYNM